MPKGISPEIGGLDFTPSGKLVVLTRRSGVQMAKPARDPARLQWQTFSDQSLHNANGLLALSDSEILVTAGRRRTKRSCGLPDCSGAKTGTECDSPTAP